MRFLIRFLLLLLPLSALAQPLLPECPAVGVKDNCWGTRTFLFGTRYVGEFRNDKPHGMGVLYYRNGERYVGEVRDGEPGGLAFQGGPGIHYLADGRVKESGTWQNGRLISAWPVNRALFHFEYETEAVLRREEQARQQERAAAEALELERIERDARQQSAAATAPTASVANEDTRARQQQADAERIRQEQQALEQRRLAVAQEAEAARQRQQEAERKLAVEAQERQRQAAEAEQQARRKEQAEREQRLTAEAEAARQRQQELEQRLAAEARERQRLMAEADAARKRQQELEDRLATEARERERLLAEARERERRQAAAARPQASNRKALVIGNDLYTDVPKLVNAVSDAEAMAAALTASGFTVAKHLNVNERRFKAALRDFRQRVEPGDEVVVFYAGHGVQVGNANYLLPTDINSENEEQVKDEAIQLQRILDDLQDRRARFALAVIDACRDNPFKGRGRTIGGRGMAPTVAATGQMIMFSAGSGQQALDRLGKDDKDNNGVFTRVFVREMAKPGVPVDKLLRDVRNEVVRLARSVGHEQTPALYDQTIGEFFFRR